MQGVTLNPGSHRKQKSREVTHNWSAALRLIDAQTKRQSHASRPSVGLFSVCLLGYLLSKSHQEMNSRLIGRSKSLHRNRLEVLVCSVSTAYLAV